jgi:hypothetical protein
MILLGLRVFLYDFIGFKPDDFETTPVVDSLAQLTSCRDIKSTGCSR